MITWYEHARAYAEAKWPNLAPVSRLSVAEALVTVTIVLTTREPGAVLLKIYAHCIDGQADAANKRITDALGTQDTQPGSEPGDEGDDDSAQAS